VLYQFGQQQIEAGAARRAALNFAAVIIELAIEGKAIAVGV